jgi:hypothetical protein
VCTVHTVHTLTRFALTIAARICAQHYPRGLTEVVPLGIDDERVGERRDVRPHDVGHGLFPVYVSLRRERDQHGDCHGYRQREQRGEATQKEHRPWFLQPVLFPFGGAVAVDLGEDPVEEPERKEDRQKAQREQETSGLRVLRGVDDPGPAQFDDPLDFG